MLANSVQQPIAENYIISFQEAPPLPLFKKIFSNLTEMLSRISLESIKNAWRIGAQNDLSKPLALAWKEKSFVSECPTPKGTIYLTADYDVMKTIFQNYRSDDAGLFLDIENKKLFIECIIRDLYPEEVKKLGVDEIANMLVLTAKFPYVKLLRTPMVQFLGAKCVKSFIPSMNAIADDILDQLSEQEKANCNTEELAFEFAVTVIAKLITGFQTSRKNYQLLAQSLCAFSKRMTKLISSRSLTEPEKNDYKKALEFMRMVIEDDIVNESPFVANFKNNGWEDFKIKIVLFFMYFAGTETTALSINYLLWQLGKSENQKYLKEIIDPFNSEAFLSKLVAETLRLHPSAFIQGRQLRKDAMLEIRNANGTIIKQMRLRKGHSILCLTQVAALDSNYYYEPEKFNPYRFKNVPSQLPWLPFGAGNHVCPGQYLAQAELKVLIARIANKFTIQTISPIGQTQQKGFFTLRATPTFIKLIKK